MRRVILAGGFSTAMGAMVAGGCASSGGADAADPAPTATAQAAHVAPAGAEPPASFLGVAAFDGRTGARVSWEDLVDRCADAQVVMIGEEHDLGPAQMMAADLFAAIVKRRATSALSLEFFERDEQIHLDDYLAGLTTEEQFRAASGRREGNYPEGHRAMVEIAKAAGVPVIASNAPRRYVRLARADGYDRLGELSPDQRATFVVPRTMPGGRYHDEFIGMMSAMGAHGDQAGPNPPEDQRRAAAEAMFRSQSLWDSTMAASVAQALRDGRRPVVHVIGRFHVDHDGGTLQMLRRVRPGAGVLTISCGRGTHASLLEADRGRADVVVYADDPPAPDATPDAAPESPGS